MSLRVWLPLTKDLRNQGLSNVTITNNGAIFNSAGKLGGSYEFNGSSSRISCSSYIWTYPISICAWFKPTDVTNSNTQYWLSYNTASGGTSGHAIGIGTYGGKLSVWFGGRVHSLNVILSNNTWYHITFTIDVNKKTTTYLNGEQIDTFTFTENNPGSTWFTIGARSNSSTGGVGGALYFYKGYMNDVRIYDHALSLMEVKQISQGLILHYPLNRNGFGVDNILINTHFDSHYTQSTGWDTTKNGTQLASSWGGYNGGVSNSSTVYHAHLKEFNGEWVYEYIKTANENWLGISQSGLQSKLTAGKTYTFSWEEYHVNGTNRVGTGLYYYKTGATSANFHLGIREAAEVIREIGRWQKYIYTFIAPNDADWSKNMSWYIYGHYNGNGTFYVRHIKLEEGSVATPWCPNSSDTFATAMGLNNNIEYDTSGYGNNGTKVGTFDYDSDTPKYNVSTVFNGSDNCIQIGNWYNLFQNPFTINVWFKKDEIGTKGYETLFGGASGFEIDTRAGNSQTLSLYLPSPRGGVAYSPFNLSQWYMVTMVSDGTNEEFYVDGILRKTIEKKTVTNSMYRIGAWVSDTGQNFKGQMSDFRIYATALSADDVKSLYNNSAYIDNQGNIYGAVYEEV